jgi:hypothetical protein
VRSEVRPGGYLLVQNLYEFSGPFGDKRGTHFSRRAVDL